MEENKNIKILNVDDNDANRYILTRILSKAGYTIIETINGKNTLSLAEIEQPNLIILDVNLPDISGYEVCQLLKSNPRTDSISILAISSHYTKDQDWIYGLECGADNYLIKPIDNHVLLATVKSMLRIQSTENKLRVALNEAEKASHIKTQFLANISHELRTPINVILSALQVSNIIVDDLILLDEKKKLLKYNGMMKQNSYRLIKLINNLIDITKIDSGFMNLNLLNLNIVKVVEDISLSVANFIESKGIEFIFDTDIEEKFIACDPNKIERIIFNLLSNAMKFTDLGGKITVNISDKGEYVLISVKDTGIGISVENQRTIFNRFLQVDDSLSRNTEGSGIGLSLVKSFVEMHDGEITVESCCNKGSTFIVKLPIKMLDTYDKANIESLDLDSGNTDVMHIEFSDIYL